MEEEQLVEDLERKIVSGYDFEFGVSAWEFLRQYLKHPNDEVGNKGNYNNWMWRQMDLLYMVNFHIDFIPEGYGNGTKFSIIQDAVEAELVKCGRVVFASNTDDVIMEKMFLQNNYKNLTFYISEEIYPNIDVVSVAKTVMNLESKVGQYLEAGLYMMHIGVRKKESQLLRYWRFTRNSSQTYQRTVKPLRVDGSLQTLLYIILVLNTVSLLSLCVELILIHYDKIKELLDSCIYNIRASGIYLCSRLCNSLLYPGN
jgi:hypothetical protein